MSRRSTLLITGGSGFIAGWCILRALEAGWKVRATLRDPMREGKIRAWLSPLGASDRLSFHHADLLSDSGWAEAMAGCKAVLHVAAPFPSARQPDVLTPARDGALRVLKAAKNAGVKRVVITSDLAAAGHRPTRDLRGVLAEAAASRAMRAARPERLTIESDWSDPEERGISSYVRAKILAERAAWDWAAKFGGGVQVVSILPGLVLGPALNTDLSPSLAMVRAILNGAMPLVPQMNVPVVDVRDLADLHLRALDAPEAAGARFVAAADTALSGLDAARLLKARFGDVSACAAALGAPEWIVDAAALASPGFRERLSNLVGATPASNAKARAALGWTPRPAEDALIAAAESLVELGAVRPRLPALASVQIDLKPMLDRARGVAAAIGVLPRKAREGIASL